MNALLEELELLLEQLAVRVLVEQRPAERLDLTGLVAAADAEDDASAGDDVRDREVLRQPQRMPGGQHVERAPELQPLRLRREPRIEQDEVREDLVALALEVVLGRPEAVEAELVHELGELLGRPVGLDQALVRIAPLVRGLPVTADVLELDVTDVQDGELRDHVTGL